MSTLAQSKYCTIDGAKVNVESVIKSSSKWVIYKLQNGMYGIKYKAGNGLKGATMKERKTLDTKNLKGSLYAAANWWNNYLTREGDNADSSI